MSDFRRRGFRLRLILDGVEGFRKKCYFFVNVYRDKYVRHVLQRIWSCFYSQLCSSADELWLMLDDFSVPPGETSLVLKEDDTVRVCLRRPSGSSPGPDQVRAEVAPLVEAPGTMETSVALLLRRLRGGSAPEDSAEAERRRLRQVAELMAADSDSSDASTEVGIAEAASPAHHLNRLAGVDRVNEKLETPRQPPAPPRERAHDISGTSLAELGRELKRRYDAARQNSQPAETSTPRPEPAPPTDVADGDCAVEEMEVPVAEATPQETAAPAGDGVTSDIGELREAAPGRETAATEESSAVGEAVGTAGEGAAGLEATSVTPAETPQRRKGQKRGMSSSSSSEEGPDSDTDYSAAKVKKPVLKPSSASASTARPQSDKPAGGVDSGVVQVTDGAAADADGSATTDPASAEAKKKKTRTRRHRGKKKRTPEVPLLPPPPRVPQLRTNDYAQRHGLPKSEIERYKRAGSVPIGWQTRPKNRKMRFDDDGNMIVDDARQEGGSDAGHDTLQQRLQRYASGPGERSRGVRWASEPEGRWRWGRGHGEQDGGASGHVTGVETGVTPAQRHNLRESDIGESPQRRAVDTLGAGEAPQSGAGTGHNSGPGAPDGVSYRSAHPPWRYSGDSEPDPGSHSSHGDPSGRPYARVPPPGQQDLSSNQSTPGRAALGAGLLPRAFMRPRRCVNPPRRSEALAEGSRDAASGRSPDCGEEAVSGEEARPERLPPAPEGGAGPDLSTVTATAPPPAVEQRLTASAGGGDTDTRQVSGSAAGSSSPLRPPPDSQPPGCTAPTAAETAAETVSNSAAAEEEHSPHQLPVTAAEVDRSDISPQCYRSTKNQRKHAVVIPPCAAPGRQRAVVTLSDGTGGAAVADVRGPDVRALLQQRRSRPLVVTRPVRPPPRGPTCAEVTHSPQPVLSGGERREAATLADSREDGEEAAADCASPSAAEGAADVRTEDSPSSVTGDVYNNVSVVLSAPSSFAVPPPGALLSPAKNDSSSDEDEGDTDEESDYAGSDFSDKYSTMRPSVNVGEKMQRRTGRPSWDGITNCNVVNEVGQSRRLEKQRAKALAGDESGHPAGGSDVKDDRFYSQFPTMKEKPQPRDIIAFKCLELDDSYCPHVTEYREASVQEVSHCGLLTLQLIGYRPTARRRGRFELVSRDDDEIVDLDEEAGLVEKSWSELIQPRLLHP